MGELTSLRYIGGGMVRPELEPRDHDHAEIRKLKPELLEAAIGSGLYAPTWSDGEPQVLVEAAAAEEAIAPAGPFLWTGPTPNPVTEAELAAADAAGIDPAEALGRASYNDLRQLAKARGLDTKGTRAALIERLVASEPAAEEPAGETD